MIGARLAAPIRGTLAAAMLLLAAVPSYGAQPPVRLLDVPYIEQSVALCGGAAAAMVMRYWGARDIYAESFAPLVDAAAGGIRGDDLLAELSRRRWEARSFRGDPAFVTSRLAAGQPVIALIEDRPGTFHYVVIVAWVNDRVVYHDPARRPFEVRTAAAFESAWARSDRWTLLVLPGESPVASEAPSSSSALRDASRSPCDGLVGAGARAAEGGDRAAALRIFASAVELCPSSSAPHREMAGVYALDGRWREAAMHARAAVGLDRGDEHAWRILATSAYVSGDAAGALEAWNAIGEPAVDTVTVHGLARTRHTAASRLIGLERGAVLDVASLRAAERRLLDLPAIETGRVQYRPLGEGRVAIDAAVVERPLWPRSPGALARVGLNAVSDREVRLDLVSPAGAGEVVALAWRWWENRPRVALSYAAPSAVGVWRAVAFREEQSYGSPQEGRVEQRRGGELALSNWTSRLLRWEVGLAFDVWERDRRTASVRTALVQSLLSGRLTVNGGAVATAGDLAARRAHVGAEVRTRTRHEGAVLVASVGYDAASARAPLAFWGGAGTGHGRDPLLRAHPLLDDGRVRGDVFGRRLAHGSAEVRRWSPPFRGVLRIAPAAFVDVAHADRRLVPGPAWHADAGVGVRVAVPGAGVLRLDVGKGLRDGATALSFALVR